MLRAAFQALIQYIDVSSAVNSKAALDGQNLYVGACGMRVQCVLFHAFFYYLYICLSLYLSFYIHLSIHLFVTTACQVLTAARSHGQVQQRALAQLFGSLSPHCLNRRLCTGTPSSEPLRIPSALSAAARAAAARATPVPAIGRCCTKALLRRQGPNEHTCLSIRR